MSKELDDLNEQIGVLRGRAEVLSNAENFEKAKKLIGKCYKYRNCFSMPASDDDCWFLYKKVISSGPDGSLKVLRFQTDKNGRFEIEPNAGRHHRHFEVEEEITEMEFDLAWQDCLSAVNGINLGEEDE